MAHVQFWQHYLLAVIAGENPPAVAHAAEGWPAGDLPAGEWEALRDQFLRDAQRLRDLTLDASLTASPDRKGRPYAVALTNSAGHSVYHLGQVVTVRQALGLWPPAGGGATW
ncbi:DinB family protein [Deinococcus sp. PESE-38]